MLLFAPGTGQPARGYRHWLGFMLLILRQFKFNSHPLSFFERSEGPCPEPAEGRPSGAEAHEACRLQHAGTGLFSLPQHLPSTMEEIWLILLLPAHRWRMLGVSLGLRNLFIFARSGHRLRRRSGEALRSNASNYLVGDRDR